MRLEAEKVDVHGRSSQGTIVHAYGLGGRGFELSWGVAEHVQQLVEKDFQDSGTCKAARL